MALEGPLLVTFIVNLTLPVTLMNDAFADFVMFKSTTGNAVILSIVSLLLDLFVSVSLLLTTT